MRARPVVGILLAAGSASRFGAAKLLARLPNGELVGVAALRNLVAAVDSTVAVVRPDDAALAAVLDANGARISVCHSAAEGMGVSLAWGVRATPTAGGWVIALADMPWIRPTTIARVADALRQGVAIAAPALNGMRGHPVGFSAKFYGELVTLTGDQGARRLLERHSVSPIDTDDTGILRDIDIAADLRG